jgi:hypothetical protein
LGWCIRRSLSTPPTFDQGLSALARQAKEAREKGDYEAVPPTAEQAAEFVEAAAEFVVAVEELLQAD